MWNKPIEGLLVTAVLTLIVANLFNIESISMIGSSGFLLVFAAVNIANVVQYRQTKSAWPVSAAGAVACVASLGTLVWVSSGENPAALWVLAGMIAVSVGIEALYRILTGRRLRLHVPEQEHRGDN